MTHTAEPAPAVSLEAYSGVEHVFEAASRQMPPVRDYLTAVWDRRSFAVALAKAQLRGGRSRTVLGELWSLLDPIFQAALYYLLIMMIRGGSGEEGEHRLIMIVSGIFLFTLSSKIIGKVARSISSHKGLIMNSTFPRLLLPLSEVHAAIINFIPVVLVYLVFHIVIGGQVGISLLLLPLLFVIQITLALGLGLVFCTLVVFIRDMSNLLDYIMRLFFFGSPILWSPVDLPSGMLAIMRFNPLFAVHASYQRVIAFGEMPSFGMILEAVFWAVLLITTGFRLFVSNERSFALRI